MFAVVVFFASHNWCHCGEIRIIQCWYGCRSSSLFDLKEVFNKEKAQSLPPHRSYVWLMHCSILHVNALMHCSILIFLAGASLPTSRLFKISRWERSHAAVHLRLASCMGYLSCFLTSKGKFYLLRRKIRHLDPTSGAKIFGKLDLFLIHGDEWKKNIWKMFPL